MAGIFISILGAVALYLVDRIVGTGAPFLVGLVGAIAPHLVDPIRRELGHLFNYHSNVRYLIDQLEKLQGVTDRVKQSIENARRNTDEIQPDVKKWLKSVNEIIKEAEKFINDEEKSKKMCFFGLCPNLKSCYQLSKKANKIAAEVVFKLQDGGKFGEFAGVSYPAPPQGIGSASIKGYEAFESRMSTLKEVMEALEDPSINMIGVYGMGGVGKTMLVEEVGRKAKEDKLFDVVVMAVVSQPLDIRKIQGEIAYALGLRFNGQEIDSERKDKLCKRLTNEKSILIILDDIWEKLDLKAIGIPSEENLNGCKILMTSRNQDTLHNEMDAQKNFLVGVLSEEEAWNLFKMMAGDSVEAPGLKPTAIEVARECAGLPLAVTAVANALKNKSLPVWKDALLELRFLTPANINRVNARVYSSLKLSYNSLESEEAKSLFLLCSLLPEDYHISIQDFLKYGKGLGLFQGISTLENERNRVHTLVHHLKASCLLLDSNTTGFVRMHDIFHDIGISIASKDKHMLIVRNGVELEEYETQERLRNCPAMSLPYSDIHELPSGLECPELKLLFLFGKDHSLEMPDDFFEMMKQLKVLNLTKMRFSSLPSSLYSLSNLQTLCLDECKLEDIARIGELKKLKVLSFVGSDIKVLPTEIGKLTRLRLLDLTDCSRLRVIPSNVIASLSQLEELYVTNSFVRWGHHGNASLAELKCLARLVTLDIHIPDTNILPIDWQFEKLMNYRIFLGFQHYFGASEISESLKPRINTSIWEREMTIGIPKGKWNGIEQTLYLGELNGIKNVLYSLDKEGFPHLKHLYVLSGCEIEHVINTMEWAPNKAFPELESLFLRDVINLKAICHGQLPAESFCNLRTVKVAQCNGLKNLFSSSMARSLLQLWEVEITECKIMEEIIAEGREEAEDNNEAMGKTMLPKLRSLKLKHLPRLTSLCSKVWTMPSLNYAPSSDARSEEIIVEDKHDIPIPFFSEKVAFLNLEELVINSVSLKEIWHSQLPVCSFSKLKYLEVDGCDHLLNIVPSNMLMSLQNMETLKVRNTGGSLKYIFDLGGLDDTKRHVPTATQLRYLYLDNLSSLKQIWKKGSQGVFLFQKLSILEAVGCPNLRNIFPSSIAKSLMQLQELSIKNCEMVEEIVEKEGAEEEAADKIVFPQLTSLILRFLSRLKSFCQGIHISEWPSLKKLVLSDCYSVKIFASEYISFEETHGKGHLGTATEQPLFLVDKVAFPNLEELVLNYSSSMKEIWQGQFHTRSFCKLRVLMVIGCGKILKVFPISFLQNFQNLEKLDVSNCSSLEEIFELGGVAGEVGHPATLPQLRELCLNSLPKLMHLWKKDCQPSLVFQNLTTLRVSSCGSLTHLLPSAIAKSLVRIKSMNVRHCEMMEEIIASEKGATTNEITFGQLSSVKLVVLPNLTSFCPGNTTFSFPSLQEVFVAECPRLKTFSNGIFSTPKLEKVNVGKDEPHWKGDLNTTIQYLFEQKQRLRELKPKIRVVQLRTASSSSFTQTSSPLQLRCGKIKLKKGVLVQLPTATSSSSLIQIASPPQDSSQPSYAEAKYWPSSNYM